MKPDHALWAKINGVIFGVDGGLATATLIAGLIAIVKSAYLQEEKVKLSEDEARSKLAAMILCRDDMPASARLVEMVTQDIEILRNQKRDSN